MTYPFPADQLYCVMDYETFSEIDLKKVGAFEYSVHPSTEILCAAWRVGTRETLRTAPIHSWSPMNGQADNRILGLAVELECNKVIMVAHNALFEQVITLNVLKKYLSFGSQSDTPSRWLCTASLVSSLAMPRNLAGAGAALKLPIQKDVEGHRLMMKWCKPRKPTKKNTATRHTDHEELERLIKYCETDVEAETLVFLKCPPLTPTERKVWELDQKINLRGVCIDRPLVTSALSMIAAETERLNHETQQGTDYKITSANQRDVVLKWLREEGGVHLPDLQKKTVEDAISSGLVTGLSKTILEFRQAVSKTSTAKYTAFDQRSRFDGRLRDILIYHTASTGRWGAVGVQLQNLPRGTIKNTIQAAEVMQSGDLELVRMLYGEPMAVFSSCIRNMIIAPKGRVLDVADYAAIEARVLAWFAGDHDALKAFRDGRDAYKELATEIFGISLGNVTPAQRFVGKTAELGCGYGMGSPKFQVTCANLGQEISLELAQQAVATYRQKHAAIVSLWNMIQRAAVAAVENPGIRYTVNKTTWYVKTGFLWCVLPSGRRLAYAQPSLEWCPPPWGGENVKTLCHWGINGYTRKWEKQRTYGGKLVENVVQAASRDLMAEAMLRMEETGIWEIVLSVHDELIAERDDSGMGTNELFCKLMAELPAWADGCPVKVEGWSGTRYRK